MRIPHVLERPVLVDLAQRSPTSLDDTDHPPIDVVGQRFAYSFGGSWETAPLPNEKGPKFTSTAKANHPKNSP